jgi:hypothetical protein
VLERFSASPSLKLRGADQLKPREYIGEIEFFYHNFHTLNSPNAMKDWRYHFEMGAGSNPSWAYVEIAEVVAYLRRHDDSEARRQITEAAGKVGGDAVTDLFRQPILVEETKNRILGYAYRGMIVRKIAATN